MPSCRLGRQRARLNLQVSQASAARGAGQIEGVLALMIMISCRMDNSGEAYVLWCSDVQLRVYRSGPLKLDAWTFSARMPKLIPAELHIDNSNDVKQIMGLYLRIDTTFIKKLLIAEWFYSLHCALSWAWPHDTLDFSHIAVGTRDQGSLIPLVFDHRLRVLIFKDRAPPERDLQGEPTSF
jgi:hypothetical protein